MFHWIWVVLLGWASGALVNYLADVLPWHRRPVAPFCLACQKSLPWANYFFWPRRCPGCGKRRSWRTWLVEAVYMGSALWLWQAPTERLGFWGGLLLLVYFGVVVVIDMEHRLILHPVSLFGAGMGLLMGAYLHGLGPTLLGGAVGFSSMYLLYKLGELLLRWAGRLRGQEVEDVALGFGDVNLSGVLGLILGWPGVVVNLFLAVLIGGAFSLLFLLGMLLLRRYRMFTALPYGPFLITATVILIFFQGLAARLFAP